MAKNKNIQVGREVLQIEAEAVFNLREKIGDSFDTAVELIFDCKGRVVVTGMGKSGLISQKIASTLASTGTPAHFMHPSEAVHGDLGIVTKDDLILAVSNSGETHEIIQLMPAFERLGVKVITFIGRLESTIAKSAEVIIDTSVEREACTLDLAPTASTTATLALGDALAIALLEKRGFQREDFALLHPAGKLGKKLLLTAKEIMHTGNELPIVGADMDVKSTLLTISDKRLGIGIVVGDKGKIKGIITDGDLRRAFEKDEDILDKTAEALIMTGKPKWITEDTLAINALEIMEKHSITSLFIYNSKKTDGVPDGILHIHDILKSGVM
ncbi:MAG: KpsF/GutQ family sugar-phosphate isomerase [Candidatus Marinimicrobia bacterium]|jgi:arabinose-5-phosphate isomerase|nr:D-arabinose 5-phosphate isomerase [Candidatus Neomarinimicrobiota bacterium]MDP6457321.1 KpsF/GutQ family sugar-phosphate isomerase [Candidatus Neomarinimicrobiota bacterium]MDP6592735.1 KpsF/GutQ family sugar-phosphate isomerase [Candidatus Neomarinimicrobiota bacterium]MDP6835797.1 KpsF/GutQ family sugar-phosphate isomerase [Candidatus Neomarinimicrobiota bacterium]MDP6966443.1 KpsF/GutQ family sugar-phosphate isomerase [Candidatus Neomarinimicrobiota bacterium]|tara:strand:- start:7805 stop:8788 length:984 start_codon:yes stop_codon:yes gene_type:complete